MKKKEYDPIEDCNRDTGLHPAIEGDVLIRATRVTIAQHIALSAKMCFNYNYDYYLELRAQGYSQRALTPIESKLAQVGMLAATSAKAYEETKREEAKEDIIDLLPSLN